MPIEFTFYACLVTLTMLSSILHNQGPCLNIKSLYHNFSWNGRIFDTFLYNNEADILYVKLWRLYNYIDHFIILVSNETFTGRAANVSFAPLEKEIARYKDKIEIVNIPANYCEKFRYGSENAWCRERSRRDYALKILEEKYKINENDTILVSDVDEILTREGALHLRRNPPETAYVLKGTMYFPYYFHKVSNWNPCGAVRYSKNMRPLTSYRDNRNSKLFSLNGKPLLTHCTYCFSTIEQYRNKLISYSHIEYSKPPYTTADWIFKSHYCRDKINSPPGHDEDNSNWREYVPDDPRLRFLVDPSFEYDISKTSYKPEDLKGLCKINYNRKPIDL